MNASARRGIGATASIGRRGRRTKVSARSYGKGIFWLLLASLAGGLLWLVPIYANGLRDPRYLDGWVLAGGMALQVYFHVGLASGRLSAKSAGRWRAIHIFAGLLLVAAFVSHSDWSLPDTVFEWALWACFVLVTLSGAFGTYLAWTMKTKRGLDARAPPDRIATRRAELAREMHAAVMQADPATAAIGLPDPPHDAWIADLYHDHLRAFLEGPRNFKAHMMGSGQPLARLMEEIDALSGYVDSQRQEKLASIRAMVVEKDRLDLAYTAHALKRGWQLLHVPFTYALVVLTVLHVLVAYAFSSGAW